MQDNANFEQICRFLKKNLKICRTMLIYDNLQPMKKISFLATTGTFQVMY